MRDTRSGLMRLMRTGAVATNGCRLGFSPGRARATTRPPRRRELDASASASQAPEDVRAPAAEVTAGLNQIQDITAQVAQAVGIDKAKASGAQRADRAGVGEDRGDGEVQRRPRPTSRSRTASPRSARRSKDGDSAKAQQAATLWQRPSTTYSRSTRADT